MTAPCVNISHDDQEDLNVTAQGKSINAIRPFVGEGVLVWGARTLDGNSLDWRYINVRRTMIMLEESIRLAAKAYVFEPNTASTWVTMRSMIENFLTGVWKQGGLAGAIPEDAFSVHVGLGETMTPVDILEGHPSDHGARGGLAARPSSSRSPSSSRCRSPENRPGFRR